MLKRLLLVLLVMVGIGLYTTQAQEFGSNWTATFYNNRNFADTPAATVSGINRLDFLWDNQPVVNNVTLSAVQPDNFSVRFTTSQNFTGGRYRFDVTWDDQVRVLIDGQTVFEDFSLDGVYPKSASFERDIAAGVHNLTVELVEHAGGAIIRFQWQLAGPVVTAGPSPTPFPTATPGPTALPAIEPGTLTATVIRAPVLLVRAGPFLGADRVGRILRGQTYAVIGRDHDARWFLLQLSDQQAWAYGYYLAINGNEFNAPVQSAFVTQGDPAASTGIVAQTTAGMRLRAEPNIYSPQTGRIPWGYILPVLARTPGDGAWWQVVYRGTVGWVFSPYLRVIEGDIADIPTIER